MWLNAIGRNDNVLWQLSLSEVAAGTAVCVVWIMFVC
jgi:hypothetical protein